MRRRASQNSVIDLRIVSHSAVFQPDVPTAPPAQSAAPQALTTDGASMERGWFLSSFDLARGLEVIEADDELTLSLFGEPQPQ